VTREVEVRRLGADEVRAEFDRLAAVLVDCVEGGASVSYLAPFSHEQARAAFEAVAADVEQGRRLVVAAYSDAELVGTVQVFLATPPNQPHRGEIAKLLVRRSARGAGSPSGSWSARKRRRGRKARRCSCSTRSTATTPSGSTSDSVGRASG
jgi:hypothetical protein